MAWTLLSKQLTNSLAFRHEQAPLLSKQFGCSFSSFRPSCAIILIGMLWTMTVLEHHIQADTYVVKILLSRCHKESWCMWISYSFLA
jgi:hypothetical protein